MNGIIADASPLIVLAKAGLLEILPRLFSKTLVPEAVRLEIMSGPEDDPMRVALPLCKWMTFEKVDPPFALSGKLKLGAGESEAIELAARHPDFTLLLDDRAGRRAAVVKGLKVAGTLTVVAMASREGYVRSFDDAVARLRKAGMFASEDVISAVKEFLEGV